MMAESDLHKVEAEFRHAQCDNCGLDTDDCECVPGTTEIAKRIKTLEAQLNEALDGKGQYHNAVIEHERISAALRDELAEAKEQLAEAKTVDVNDEYMVALEGEIEHLKELLPPNKQDWPSFMKQALQAFKELEQAKAREVKLREVLDSIQLTAQLGVDEHEGYIAARWVRDKAKAALEE